MNYHLCVHKFIIASNKNHILSDFFQTGIYDANREFYKTNAPAMDILVSSNLERLIYMLSSHKEDVNQYMNTFNKTGVYEVDEDMKDLLHQYFYAHYQNEQDVLDNIEECYNKYHYLLDTHTAVGYGVYKHYVDKTKDSTKNILLSTASPYKFPQSVYQALTQIQIDDYDAIEQLNQITGVPVPKPPNIAGATLSGCPSIFVASSKIACLSSLRSLKAYAPTIPATIQVELLPSPLV